MIRDMIWYDKNIVKGETWNRGMEYFSDTGDPDILGDVIELELMFASIKSMYISARSAE